MALSEEDKAAILGLIKAANDETRIETQKLVNGAISARLERFEGAVNERLAKAQPTEPKPSEDPEAKTNKQRIGEIEAELNHWKQEAEKARAKSREDREDAEFRTAWSAGLDGGKVRFVPGLADDHLASLRRAGRLVTDEKGTVRVQDPALGKYDTHPTVGEYLAALPKSDRGKIYLEPTGVSGSGAKPARTGAAPNGAESGQMTDAQAWRALRFAGSAPILGGSEDEGT